MFINRFWECFKIIVGTFVDENVIIFKMVASVYFCGVILCFLLLLLLVNNFSLNLWFTFIILVKLKLMYVEMVFFAITKSFLLNETAFIILTMF